MRGFVALRALRDNSVALRTESPGRPGADNKKADDRSSACSHEVVERRGIEPLTFAMRTRRSPS